MKDSSGPEKTPTYHDGLTDLDYGLVEATGIHPSAAINDQTFLKPFSTISAMGVGANTTNSAFGVILTLAVWLPYGGPAFTIYSYIVMGLVGTCTGISLAELASAMPHPGGQYVWVARLAPPRTRRFLSYVTALMNWASAVCTGASVTLSGTHLIASLAQLLYPNANIPRWTVFLGYLALNYTTMVPSLFEKLLPHISKFMMAYTGSVLVIIFVTLFAAADQRLDGRDLFTGLDNQSGWPAGVAVLIGMNSPNWCFSCLDTIVHIADEVPHPERNIPKAILWTIPIGLVTGLMILFAALVNCPTPDDITSYAYFHIVYTVLKNNQPAAIAIQILLFFIAWSTQLHIHVWQSRLAWNIARHHGLPPANYIGFLAGSPFHSPVWATLFSSVFTSILGVVYVGSNAAFSSFISCGIIFQYFTYMISVCLLLSHGRSRFARGPFWTGRVGYLFNGVVVVWSIVSTIFYCFPYYKEVVADEMNYVSPILCGFLALFATIWILYARRRWEATE